MNSRSIAAVLLVSLFSAFGWGQSERMSALSCADFRPTQEALDRFPNLVGACEAVVEKNGELYGKFTAVVRRASGRGVTLYLPATDRTFTVEPDADARVLIGTRKVRPRDLNRGDEISIYVSTSALARPNLDEITLVSESDLMLAHSATRTATLPTTASPLPVLGLLSLGLLGAGYLLRRRAV